MNLSHFQVNLDGTRAGWIRKSAFAMITLADQ